MHRSRCVACFALLLPAWTLAGTPALEVRPATLKPGDPVLVIVTGASEEPSGTVGGRLLTFYAVAGRHEALGAVPVEQPEGAMAVSMEMANGSTLSAEVQVLPPDFPVRELTVAAKFIAPPPSVKRRLEADRRAFAEAFDQDFGPRLFIEGFASPTGTQANAHFGDLRTFNGKKESQHYGLDLDGKMGDPIRAANDGRVVLVRDCYTSGNTVILQHGGGLYTAYFHMSRFRVKLGERVTKGDVLGEVGKTGRVTGPHLHLAVRADGLYVNPEALLAIDWR